MPLSHWYDSAHSAGLTAAVRVHTAAGGGGGISVDPQTVTANIRVVLIGLVGVVLLVVGLVAIAGPGRKGNTAKSVDILVASSLGLLLAAAGALSIGVSLGSAFLGWVIPGVSN